jgi:hypothetical protein
MRMWYSLMLVMVGEMTSGSYLVPAMFLGVVRGIEPDQRLHSLVVGHHSRHGLSCCHCSVQHLDDVPGRHVPGAAIHDVELLVALILARVGVRVAIDTIECPLGVLELHLLLLVALGGNLLLAFPLLGRCAIVVWLLLLLLTELLYELLDVLALLCAVVLRVVYRALRTTLVAAEGLPRSPVATWAMTHTRRCYSSNGSSGSSGQRLVFAAALSSDNCIGLTGLPCL